MKKYLIFLMITSLLLGCTSCTGNDSSQTSESVAAAVETTLENETESACAAATETEEITEASSTGASDNTSSAQKSGTLHFVDVFQKPYDVEIRTELKQHPYNWDNMKVEDQTRIYEDEEYVSRYGIDISKHQGDVDWDKIKESGVEFVILRIGYRGYGQKGILCADEKFQEYYKGAKAVGLDVGVYLFSQAISTDEAIEEAELVLEQLDGKELQLPVFFDPENILDDDARTDNETPEQFTANTVAFCKTISDAGYEVGVYSNMLFEAYTLDLGQLQDYPIWYADYESLPQTPYDFTFWQYTEKGTVPGIDGIVDLDIQMVKKN